MTPHLTQDQITDIVIEGAPAPAYEPHLSACLGCRERVEQELALFSTSVSAFNQSSLAWSAAQPRPVLPRQTFPRLLAPALAFAALAVAFVLAPLHQEERPTVAPVSASELAEDNALLQQVNVALAANEPSPMDEYQLQDASSRQAGTPSAGVR